MTEEQENTAIFVSSTTHLRGKNMLAVVSGTQSCGKTFFAINLAQALGMLKKHALLFDADNGLYNTKKQLGLNLVKDLDSVVYGRESLNQIVYSYDKGHFDLICSNPDSSALLTMSVGRLQILSDDLDILAQNYEKVILDISAGMTNPSKVFGGIAQSAIMICAPIASAIAENYELMRMIASHFPKTKINIVINKVNSFEEGERTYDVISKMCTTFLESTPPLLGIVRNDTRVRDSIKNQSTILNRYPESEAARDIVSIAKRIVDNG